jgi:PAS domain S-box-containing protein
VSIEKVFLFFLPDLGIIIGDSTADLIAGKRSEKRYRDLAESISDVFFAMDNNLRYTYWNAASEKLMGISAKDAIGKSLLEIFPEMKDTEIEQFCRNVMRTKHHQTLVGKYQIKGQDFIFEIDAYPTKDGVSVSPKISLRSEWPMITYSQPASTIILADTSPVYAPAGLSLRFWAER